MQCRVEGLTEAAAVYASADEEKAAAAAVPAAAVPDDWEAEEIAAAVKDSRCKGPADRWQRLSGKTAKVIQFALNGGGDKRECQEEGKEEGGSRQKEDHTSLQADAERGHAAIDNTGKP